MKTNPSGCVEDLRRAIRGDVYHDPLVLGMYATDASIYQITPLAVVCPKDEDDVRQCLRIANHHKAPILARGGGTSLAGQTVAEAIVLDFSKYMNSILLLEDKTVVVQPGVIRHQLNTFLLSKKLEFAPDPATSSRATIGGMIANNSSGTKSILYGKTGDHVISLKVLLADGTVIRTKALSSDELQQKLVIDDPDSRIYKAMMAIALPIQDEVELRFPKTMRRVGGYALDDYLASGCGDLNRLIIGSEGTLGIVLEATLKLVDLPKYKGISVVQFDKPSEAIRGVLTMVKYKPAAVEILSKLVLGFSRKNLETSAMCGFLKGEPEAIQMIEFYGEDPAEIEQRANAMQEDLKSQGLGYAHDYYPEGQTYRDIWGIRERGLGLLLGEPSDKRGVPGIEDAAIPLEHLERYIADVVDICSRYDVSLDYYAHASVGVIHVRPILDLRLREDIERFKKIVEEVFQRVVHYGGSWSSEHGDGLARSGHLRAYYGDRIYEAFRKTKEIFDPGYIFNPGNIIDPPPIDSHLRYGETYKDQPFDPVFQYRDQRDFYTAVHQCSGLGACRKISGGTMCPSFMVTRDEVDSTRGRANALRLAMSGQLEEGLAHKGLPEVLDLCLSCKACKAECPSSVDMARLKGEVMQHHFDHYGASWKDRMIGRSPELARLFSGKIAPLVNMVQSTPLVKQLMMKLMGLDIRRNLPSYAGRTWTDSVSAVTASDPDVILLVDTYTQCHQPSTGKAAYSLLQHLGKKVMLLDVGCCQRPRISHGFLREAAIKVKSGVEKLKPWLERNIPIGVLEPGCVSAWTDDIPDLIEDDATAKALKKIKPFDQLLWDILQTIDDAALRIQPLEKEYIVHGHCHQKALYGMQAVKSVFTLWPEVIYSVLDSGCCGMAGSFGYESRHYAISQKMAERVLLPAIEDRPEAVIISNGFSCRHQIRDFSGRAPLHLAEVFALT